MHNSTIIICLQILFSGILFIIQKYMPEAYMDEEIHLDQLEHYTNGDYTYWNPLLTTPPGLYLLDLVPLKIIKMLYDVNILLVVRAFNIFLFGNISILMSYKIFNYIYPGFEKINFQRAILFCMFPTNFFFLFFFYTDSASTCLILILLYSTLKEYYFISFISAVICPFVRQTNIIWVVYVCFRVFMHKKKVYFINQEARIDLTTQFSTLFYLFFDKLGFLLKKNTGHFISVFLFIIFLYWNEGVALGHKEFHQFSFHPTQMLYLIFFVFFHLAISPAQYFSNFKSTVFQIFRSKTLITVFSLLILVFTYVVHHYTIIHPFLLSDNRHYLFYIFKNFFINRENFKYWLCPIYALMTIYLYPLTINSKDKVLVFFGGIFCTMIVLIPTPLVELRYFTIPLFFVNLEIKSNGNNSKTNNSIFNELYLNIIFYLTLNIGFIYIFVFRSFSCPNFGICRFMF